ncbi:hypothetical protein U8527_11050 [Kordia algicida OT-1]|uniref:Uncharacterized protein n=1 Tax=Kordia algicida OT-1 TaxID=391587 RepID=A9EBY1_9FLAO|nr:hypothetical protein [Kordia algicida]EDP94410.1 hypothetical protein KAOT1_04545 [Kordia algicida OT-1]
MKKTIFIIIIFAFCSCSTDHEETFQEEARTVAETVVNKTNYSYDQWGSINTYDPINREAVKIWMTYGHYNSLRRQGTQGMEILKVPNQPIYAIDAGRMNVGMPNIGNPLPFAGCNYFNDLANSSSPWALQFLAGEITLAQAIVHEQVSQQAEANATGQAISFVICYDGVVVGFVCAVPDDTGFVSNPGGVANEPGELSGSWSPAE